jgi:hypothetical protein
MPLLSHWPKNSANPARQQRCGHGHHSKMRKLRPRPQQLATILAVLLVLFLVIAGCVISPRRIVNQSPSPTPTASPTATVSPTPTPTPTPMAATVPAQFLFIGQSDMAVVTGFRINSDGSLAPIPGSPFTISAPVRSLMAARDTLIVASGDTVSAFRVDKETGSIHPPDSTSVSITEADPSSSAAGPNMAVLDATGKFMYVADITRSELLPFRVENGKLFEISRSATPIPNATTSVAIVKP